MYYIKRKHDKVIQYKQPLFLQIFGPWPLSSKMKTITMAIYVKSMLAYTLLRR